MVIAVKAYRDLAGDELDEWEQLAKSANRSPEARLGSDLRWAELTAEDSLIRLWDEDELRACAWVTQRAIDIAGREARVAGVRGVATDPEHRRRGYGTAVMERAHELMRSLPCELALLFSSVMAVRFYESLGWRAIGGPVTCEQPGGAIDYTERLPTAPVMALVLREGVELPSGPIDVRGLPW
jgi:GNAT superfamily N-acetyltransferase